MNLIDPNTVTPEVLRRAVSLYCAAVHPGSCPYFFDDGDNDMGIDGRFNLSMLGRFIEEAIVLDAITTLKPSCDISQVERIVRLQMSVERSRPEYERFITALSSALALNRVRTEALIRPIVRTLGADHTFPATAVKQETNVTTP